MDEPESLDVSAALRRLTGRTPSPEEAERLAVELEEQLAAMAEIEARLGAQRDSPPLNFDPRWA